MAYSISAQIQQQLLNAKQALKTEDEVLNELTRDKITQASRDRLCSLLTVEDILQHYDLREILSTMPMSMLLGVTVERYYQEQEQKSIHLSPASLSSLANLLIPHIKKETHIGSNGVAHKPTCTIVLAGVFEEHRADLRKRYPLANLVFLEKTDHDPQHVPDTTTVLIIYSNCTSKRQRGMLNRRFEELHLPRTNKYVIGTGKPLSAVRETLDLCAPR